MYGFPSYFCFFSGFSGHSIPHIRLQSKKKRQGLLMRYRFSIEFIQQYVDFLSRCISFRLHFIVSVNSSRSKIVFFTFA